MSFAQRLGKYIPGRRVRRPPATRQQFSARSINQNPTAHHDALEFPDGRINLVTPLEEGEQATVTQLPVMHEGARAAELEKAKA